jgi:hypothetical protein
MTIFQPLQPVLALAAMALLGYALFLRLRAVRAFPRTLASGTKGET